MSSSRNYSLVEPHPHTTSPYVHTARGGAGNIIKSSFSQPFATSTSTPRSSIDHKQPNTFKSGRGGAGNVHHSSERAIFSFDEELERQMRQQDAMAPVYHVGRGGAGNMIYRDSSTTRPKDSETASARSTSSAESGADVAAKGVRRSLEKGWAKMVSANTLCGRWLNPSLTCASQAERF
jgi:hypothetical protein